MLIGVDAGTSVVKAVAFDAADGAVLRVAARPTRTVSPAPGWAEQEPEEVVAAVGETIREAAAGDVPTLVGLTAQGDGLWPLDAAGRATRPAILWSDARAADVVARWQAAGVTEALFRRTGTALFAGAAGPILAHLRQHEPETLRAAATAASCTGMLVQRLTGARATDASLPFLDPRSRAYAPDLLEACEAAALGHLLAPVDSDPGPLRPLAAEGAALTGLPAGTPLHAGPFDFPATLLGAGVARPGDGLVVVGTTLGCGVLLDAVATDGPPAGMLVCLPQPGRWLRIMPAMVGTPSLEWALATLGIGRDALDATLAASPPGAHGVLCLPLFSPSGERAPFVDPAARGQLIGVSLDTSRADLLRAVCEGIAYAARHCLEAAGLGRVAEVRLSGGGMRSPVWRQILADVLQRPLLLARQPEVGARGAAMAALAAAGLPFDPAAWTRPEQEVAPNPALASLHDAGYARYLDRLAAARGHWAGPG